MCISVLKNSLQDVFFMGHTLPRKLCSHFHYILLNYLFYPLHKYWSPKHFYLCLALATIAFEQATYNVVEGTGSVDVCVEISGLPAGGLGCDVTVDLNLVPGTRASMYMYVC